MPLIGSLVSSGTNDPTDRPDAGDVAADLRIAAGPWVPSFSAHSTSTATQLDNFVSLNAQFAMINSLVKFWVRGTCDLDALIGQVVAIECSLPIPTDLQTHDVLEGHFSMKDAPFAFDITEDNVEADAASNCLVFYFTVGAFGNFPLQNRVFTASGAYSLAP